MSVKLLAESMTGEELLSGFLLEKTAKLMKLHFSRSLANHASIDITADQWIILDILHQQSPLSQQMLAEMAMKDAPTVTRILDLLESKKYITRENHPADRRKFNIVLTRKGEKMYHTVWPLAQSFRAECYQGLTSAELNTFSKVLSKIQHQLHQLS